MKIRVSKIFLIFLLWTFIILIKVIFPDSIGKAQYNGYIIAFAAVYCYALSPSIDTAIISLFSFLVLCLVSKDILHPIGDTTIIMMTLSAVKESLNSKLSVKEIKSIFTICSIFIILDCAGLMFPQFYSMDGIDGRRYNGILHSGNISATVLCLCQIVVYEIKRNTNQSKKYLLVNIIILLLMLFGTKTRSVLMFMPYWVLIIYKSVNRKIFYLGLASVIILISVSIVTLQSNLRLEEDGSIMTRTFLYQSMFEGILQNKFLIPHGSNSANSLSKYLTSNDNFAPHNDILLYLYDWGIIFFLFLYYLYKLFKKKIKFDLTFITILFGWSSACLHNVLLFPQIMFIFLVSINIHFNKRIICCKKI